ncbi:hypothetical protein M885DRAFT_616391 [Pelagophyceae sp. CCMP2097]|nr:hypothetical protein M885DRAFT_616391 [Pelagophyceae sp. CCMP2097]|mmetsp:Transcript_8805/g.29028  ORF Transcript_8805/g.29028 Transcript_8805/m.29028 type:complete len:466 (-) Transcript_8805:19-1416(-)
MHAKQASHTWLLYVIAAAILDALTDVASDHVIECDEDEDDSGADVASGFDEAAQDVECAPCHHRRSTVPQKPTTREADKADKLPAEKHGALADKGLLHGWRKRVAAFAADVQWRLGVGVDKCDDKSPRQKLRTKLTSEQDLLCSCWAMFAVSIAIWQYSDFSILPPSLQAARVFDLDDAIVDNAQRNLDASADTAYLLCCLGGFLYGFAMMSIMKAWEHVPSTIVTPMMQLSGPLVEIIEASLGAVARRRGKGKMGILASVAHATLNTSDWVAFGLITLGGLLPSTESLPQMFQWATWARPSMALLFTANVLYAAYYALSSLCVANGEFSDARGTAPAHEYRMDEIQFVVVSNLTTVATLGVLFTCSPTLRRHGRNLKHVSWTPKVVSALAELTNYASMLVLTCAYKRHYSSALVTAARSGLNQFTNVVAAVALFKCARIGRPVHDLKRKLVAASIVSFGLVLTM